MIKIIRVKSREDLRKAEEGNVLEIADLDLGFIEIPEKVTLKLGGRASVGVLSLRRIEARDRSKIKVLGTSVALLFDNASGEFYGNSSIYLRDKSKGYFFKRSRADLSHKTLGMFYDQSEGTLTFKAKGIFSENSKGILKDTASGRFYDASEGEMWDQSKGEFFNWSFCRTYSPKAQIKLYGDSKKIEKTFNVKNLEKWLQWNNVECIEEKGQKFIILYKWVRRDYKDFFSGTIDYSAEKIEAPDWDPEYEEECGRGIHLATDTWTAFSFKPFKKGRMLKFKVPIEDIVPYFGSDSIFPYKVRVPKLERPIAELRLKNFEWKEV